MILKAILGLAHIPVGFVGNHNASLALSFTGNTFPAEFLAAPSRSVIFKSSARWIYEAWCC